MTNDIESRQVRNQEVASTRNVGAGSTCDSTISHMHTAIRKNQMCGSAPANKIIKFFLLFDFSSVIDILNKLKVRGCERIRDVGWKMYDVGQRTTYK